METNYFDIDYQIANSIYGELFHQVQMSGVFPDSKTFPDCSPNHEIELILADFIREKNEPNFDLKSFVLRNFNLPELPQNKFETDIKKPIDEHIQNLWPFLIIEKKQQEGTYLALPKPFVVPGGRFQELYYWDSYFTCLGLIECNRLNDVENILDNFAYLIETYGFVPNGNRSYFLSRSQPPFFSVLVDLFAKTTTDQAYEKYLPSILKEYSFWMDGKNELTESNKSAKRVVKIGPHILNRYWDKLDTPRPESYGEDLELFEKIQQKTSAVPKEIYRNIRAAAESGWDFSSRWFADGMNMESIQTIDLLPVDLNCLIYFMEKTLAFIYSRIGNNNESTFYLNKSIKRQIAINELFWHEEFYYDFNFKSNNISKQKTLAATFPLFFNVATAEQANKLANGLEKEFLQIGGMVTSLVKSGQQWDWPNGWAPLQWITYFGLKNYGHDILAQKIKENWLQKVIGIYKKEGKLTEKYDIESAENISGGGGEYPNQDGFGWTNGVTAKFINERM